MYVFSQQLDKVPLKMQLNRTMTNELSQSEFCCSLGNLAKGNSYALTKYSELCFCARFPAWVIISLHLKILLQKCPDWMNCPILQLHFFHEWIPQIEGLFSPFLQYTSFKSNPGRQCCLWVTGHAQMDTLCSRHCVSETFSITPCFCICCFI